MSAVSVIMRYPADAPPDDAVAFIDPTGWNHFTTGTADAWVMRSAGQFVLHRIESRIPGHGARLLAVIGQWADTERLDGWLICHRDLVPYYERNGWRLIGHYVEDSYEMARVATVVAS